MLISAAAAVCVAAYVQSDRLRSNAAAEAVSLSTTLSNGIVATESAMEQQMLVAARMLVAEAGWLSGRPSRAVRSRTW